MKIKFYQRILILSVLLLVVSALVPCIASGQQDSIVISKRRVFDYKAGYQGDDFGYAVAVDGSTLAVGVPSDNDGLDNSGSACLFSYTDLLNYTDGDEVPIASDHLTEGDDSQKNEYFGNSLDISGDALVVGAYYDNINGTRSGVAYVMSVVNTDEQSRLTPSNPSAGDQFGNAVAISGNRVVVANKKEGVYVFDYDGSVWQEAKLTPEDAQDDKKFGTAVAIDGDTIAVGAINRSNGYSNTGSVYVFTYDGSKWEQEAELFGNDLGDSDKFGSSVALEGDTLVVGAPRHDDGETTDSGAAYVFRRNAATWTPETQEQKLTASDLSADARFGNSVALSGDTVVVGAYKDDLDLLEDVGSAYIFRFDGSVWQEQKPKLTPYEPYNQGEEFGCSVAISGHLLLVGAHKDDVDVNGNLQLDAGSVYVFTLAPENQPPVADAGEKQEVEEGSLVTLKGSDSYDLDGDELQYLWTQIGEPLVELDDPTKAEPTFEAPACSGENLTLTFQLVVNDGRADCIEPAEVEITVLQSTKNVTEITSALGSDHRPWGIDKDIYTFHGTEGKQVTVTLKAKSAGKNNHGDRATLKLKDNIRGVSFYRIDSGSLPNQICATLPATGEYHIIVAGQPRFFRGKRFSGEYTLTLEGPSGSLEKGAGSSATHNKPGCSSKPHKQHPIWSWILSRFGH